MNDPISRVFQKAESTKERNRGGSFLPEIREVMPDGPVLASAPSVKADTRLKCVENSEQNYLR